MRLSSDGTDLWSTKRRSRKDGSPKRTFTWLEVPKPIDESWSVSERGVLEPILVGKKTSSEVRGISCFTEPDSEQSVNYKRVVAWHLRRPTTMAKSVKTVYLVVHVLLTLEGDSLERDWGSLIAESERASLPFFCN